MFCEEGSQSESAVWGSLSKAIRGCSPAGSGRGGPRSRARAGLCTDPETSSRGSLSTSGAHLETAWSGVETARILKRDHAHLEALSARICKRSIGERRTQCGSLNAPGCVSRSNR